MILLTTSQSNEILDQIMDVMRQLNQLWGLQNLVAARSPATEQDLLELQRTAPHPPPPSYIRLLSIHNGVEDFYGLRGRILPCNFRSTFPDFDREWRRPNILVFVADDDWNAVAFDANTLDSDGEMGVLEIAENVDADRWPSLSEFLIGYHERLAGWLAAERADRSKAEDD